MAFVSFGLFHWLEGPLTDSSILSLSLWSVFACSGAVMSPWTDLTLSNPSVEINSAYDVVRACVRCAVYVNCSIVLLRVDHSSATCVCAAVSRIDGRMWCECGANV